MDWLFTAKKRGPVKKIALFVAILFVSIIVGACVDKIAIQSKEGISITLSDATVFLCKGWVYFETDQPLAKLAEVRCMSDKGFYLRIPGEKVVKIEIHGVKK